MLLKSQTIINQEELVSILEAQLKKAKSRLTELTKADTKIKSIVEELESLLTEHPDYKLLVSERLKLKEPEPTIMPVRIEIESVSKTAEYTESEIEAYDSLFGDGPPQTAPQTEEIITEQSAQIESPYSSEAEIVELKNLSKSEQAVQPVNEEQKSEQVQSQTDSTPEPTLEELKQQLLNKATRAELDTFKANIGEAAVKEIWESCSIPERNQIKCISQAKVANRVPATLGYKFQYTAPITKAKYEAIYLGYYLHGQPVKKDNERVIFVEEQAIICTKDDIRPYREQPGISEDARARLEALISEPAPDMDDQPTADEIASNTFTGLAPNQKLQPGPETGNKPEPQPSESAVQTELDLKTPPVPLVQKPKATATPLLELVASEIKKVNPVLTFDYDSNGKSTFLDIYHDSDRIGTFEDDDGDLWPFNTTKMLHQGFTNDMIDAMCEIGLSPKA